jgi:trimeric autotransporter adhesin
MRTVIRLFGFATLLAATSSCGNVITQGRSPSLLVVNSIQSAAGGPLFSSVVKAPTADVGTATLSLAMKDVSVTPTSNNQVTINRYTVTYSRTDGGVGVPQSFDGAVTATLAGTTPSPVAFELVRQAAKQQSPLVELTVNPNTINTIATVTFYGQDLVGNAVSASGTIVVDFGSVTNSPAPSGDWVFSPTLPVVADTVLFNADGIRAAPGHTIVEYSWNFGDQFSATSNTASGIQVTHVFTVADTYTVVLSVRDEVGQKTTLAKTVKVDSGGPIAKFTFAITDPLNHVVTVDGSSSTATGTAAIKDYKWTWGDGQSTDSGAATAASHTYAAAGPYVITVTVTDTLNRVGSLSQSVTVP